MKYYLICLIVTFLTGCSLKNKKTTHFQPIKISNIKIINDLDSFHNYFETHNSWLKKSIDSFSVVNQTIVSKTNNINDFLNFELVINFNKKNINHKEYVNYSIDALPLHSIFESKIYPIYGHEITNYVELDSFNYYQNYYQNIFYGYLKMNFFGAIIPWNKILKSVKMKNNFISFSVDKIIFKDDFFTKTDKSYLIKVINNSFIKRAEINNLRVAKILTERNNFFINFYNNKKRLFSKKTDYTIDFEFSLTQNKDSIIISPKYYTKRKKEMNLLIPEILKSSYFTSKKNYDLGNHIDINILINMLIANYIGNNIFIRYEAYK